MWEQYKDTTGYSTLYGKAKGILAREAGMAAEDRTGGRRQCETRQMAMQIA